MQPIKRHGFTLIEILVVIAIIAILVAMLVPAVQVVRQAASRAACQNNLHQIGIALHNFEASYKVFPPAGSYPAGVTADSWSVQAHLLPFVEQHNLKDIINFSASYAVQPQVTQVRVPVYLCPSEANDRPRPDGTLTHYPLSYSANMGTWLVYDPRSGTGGSGAFSANLARRAHSFNDGLSNTLGFAEVKGYTPYLRDGGIAGFSPPTSPAEVAAFGGQFKSNSGHTEWVDARVHQTGFTTVFPPNTVVPYSDGGLTYDIDFNSSREGKSTTRPTFAAVTARSYHPGLVNALLMDGSVRAIRNHIQLGTWRALGTADGNDAVEDF